jgi:hypothetical protein
MVLEEIYQNNLDIEDKFEKKKILFIGSESYDSATITVIEGLFKLGFEILVFKKNNINSWFCNKIIYNLDQIEEEIDLVISNLHWGTRWSLYQNLNHKVPYILINGDDRIHGNDISSWKDMYDVYKKKYHLNPPEEIKDMDLAPYRWVEDIGDYFPDKIFMSQKYKVNNNCIYLPFGIHNMYKIMYQNKKITERKFDISHIPGPGEERSIMEGLIKNIKIQNNFNILNQKIYGDLEYDSNINYYISNDKNIHSWHRWGKNQIYFNTLNQSKILIYPSIDKYNAPGWDSKRPWEALACGCILLTHQPYDFDNHEYPINEISDLINFKYQDYNELFQKCNYILNDLEKIELEREIIYSRVIKYFTSEPIARYFLNKLDYTRPTTSIA